MKSPFQIAVINDELPQDFGQACGIDNVAPAARLRRDIPNRTTTNPTMQ